jgi:hypothetical protein
MDGSHLDTRDIVVSLRCQALGNTSRKRGDLAAAQVPTQSLPLPLSSISMSTANVSFLSLSVTHCCRRTMSERWRGGKRPSATDTSSPPGSTAGQCMHDTCRCFVQPFTLLY